MELSKTLEDLTIQPSMFLHSFFEYSIISGRRTATISKLTKLCGFDPFYWAKCQAKSEELKELARGLPYSVAAIARAWHSHVCWHEYETCSEECFILALQLLHSSQPLV